MMEAVPVVCLFVIYAAVIVSTKREPQSISNNKIVFYLYKQLVLKQGAKILLLSVFAIVSVNFLFKQLISAKAFAVNNQVTTEIRTGNFSTAIEMLDDYKEALADNDTYWMNYGKALMHQKKYSEALVKFDKAKQLTSNPDLYILMGKCNMLLQQYTNAEQLFGIAKGIYPSKIQPTYELMLLYLKKEDYQSAFKKANEIITLVPKVTSPQTIFYKAQAYKTVQEINTKNISITSKTTK